LGRKYEIELQELAETYDWVRGCDIAELQESVNALRSQPLIAIGSGGSRTACVFVSSLHEQYARLASRYLTPLAFLNHPVPQSAGVFAFSAGGRNPDILAAARHAMNAEYGQFVALCTRPGSPLGTILDRYRHACLLEFVGPSRKDGFLATNSLLLTCALLARAYGADLPETLPALTDREVALVWSARAGKKSEPENHGGGGGDRSSETAFESLVDREIVLMADGWSVPAATDLESKWAETGLGPVTVVDARNFSHGRHVGLAVRAEQTTVLAFSVAGTAECQGDKGKPGHSNVIDTTLSFLPPEINAVQLTSPLSGAAGGLDLLVSVFRLAGEAGRLTGIDPGRPSVPDFGRKLYKAGIPKSIQGSIQTANLAKSMDLWILRKVTPVVWANAAEAAKDAWREMCSAWRTSVEKVPIGGLVLDYDGTLCEVDERAGCPSNEIGVELTRLIEEGMVVGVATGRGKSALEALREVIPERFWHSVRVGLYNGGVLVRLDHVGPVFEPDTPLHPILDDVKNAVTLSGFLHDVAVIEIRPTQIMIQPKAPLPEGLLGRLVREILCEFDLTTHTRVVDSDHSVDVLPNTVSKNAVVDQFQGFLLSRSLSEPGIMTIGDQGRLNGNDYPLLSHPLGLSVDTTSCCFRSCWNVAPAGARRTSALLGYLRALKPLADGNFGWSATRASKPLRVCRHPRSKTPSRTTSSSVEVEP